MENVHEADVAQAGGLPVPDLHGYLIPINCENSGLCLCCLGCVVAAAS